MSSTLKISLPGKDVKTAAPEDLAVHSGYDTLKLIISNSNPYAGEIFVTFKDNPAVGIYRLFTFKHQLPNHPFYYIFFDRSNSSKNLSTFNQQDTGMEFDNDVFGNQAFIVTDTGDGFTVDYVAQTTTFDMTAQYFSFKYFVFVNDGT